MALNDVRWICNNKPTINADGSLVFEIWVEYCTQMTPTVAWAPIGDANHYDVKLPNVEFTEMVKTGTNAQKQAAVIAFLTNAVKERSGPAIAAFRASKALDALLPGGVWPVAGVTQLVP